MNAVANIVQPLLTGISAEEARKDGFRCLSPVDRAVAIEFATTGHALRQVAQDLQMPLADVKKSFNNPIVRAFIYDLQMEVAQHKIINAAWVEQQVLGLWPQFIGEEDTALVGKDGCYVGRKFHSAEVASILKHYSGNADQKKAGGVQVMINFGDLGIQQKPQPQVNMIDAD